MTRTHALTPAALFGAFATDDSRRIRQQLDELAGLSNERKAAFLEPAVAFLDQTLEIDEAKRARMDPVRGWAVEALERIGSGSADATSSAGATSTADAAFNALMHVMEDDPVDMRLSFGNTRYRALRALEHLSAGNEARRARFWGVVEHIDAQVASYYQGKVGEPEPMSVRALTRVLMARERRPADVERVTNTLLLGLTNSHPGVNYQSMETVLRALRDYSLPQVNPAICAVLSSSPSIDLRRAALRALAVSCRGDYKSLRAIGDALRGDHSRDIRLEAVKVLGRVGDPMAQDDLLAACEVKDSEVRDRAARALTSILSKDQAIAALTERALQADPKKPTWGRLVGALRVADLGRQMTTDTLSAAMESGQPERARRAEAILTELGGTAAVKRLTQRQAAINRLDQLLTDSEKTVRVTFEATIKQARRNFYFAMIINALMVAMGVALMVVALAMMAGDATRFYEWLIPGATGLLGVIASMYFNSPRKNAREDLATLMNVNIIFLGYLRKLNEIDATFKHAYLENDDFGPADMKATVAQIEQAMRNALDEATEYLLQPGKEPPQRRPQRLEAPT